MGFLAHGKPKGFAIQGETLTVWADGPGSEAAVHEASLVVERMGRTPGEIVRRDGRVQMMVERPHEPRVWVVAHDVGLGEQERLRWEARGYSATLVPSITGAADGLIVAVHEDNLGYEGHLPRHPDSGAMVQSWH